MGDGAERIEHATVAGKRWSRRTIVSPPRRPSPRYRTLHLERLEARTLLSIEPLTLADPSLYGRGGVGASVQPSISADGQLVAFTSAGDDLLSNDGNGMPDAFVYDRSTCAVTLVSVGLNGMAVGIDPGTPVVISPDGEYAIFGSTSGDLVTGVTNPSGFSELYLRNLATDTTSLLSVAAVRSR
jgi:hypothetical protein